MYTQEQISGMTVDQLKAAVQELQTASTSDLSTMTADQLLVLSETEWGNFKTTVEAAMKAKGEEKKAALKAKFTAITDKALPVIKYAAGAAVLLKVFNVI